MYQNWIRHQHCIFITNIFFLFIYQHSKPQKFASMVFFFIEKKNTVQGKQTAKIDSIPEAKDLKIRIRGGWGERRRSDAITDLNEHWHVCIITLFTAYSGLSLSLKRYWTPNLNILLYSALSSNLTPSQKRPINLLKPSSVKYVCVYHVCIHLRYYLYNMLHIEAIGLLQRISFSY